MFIRALLAFFVLPGLFAGIVPPVVAAVDPWRSEGWTAGGVILGTGSLVLLWCVRDFYAFGKGTLGPWEPPKRLVVIGLYRFTRNPMYLGVLMVVGGWACLTASPLLAIYLAALAIGFHLRVLLREEPWLAKQFGPEWLDYAAHVPRWLPRLAPRRGETGRHRPGADRR